MNKACLGRSNIINQFTTQLSTVKDIIYVFIYLYIKRISRERLYLGSIFLRVAIMYYMDTYAQLASNITSQQTKIKRKEKRVRLRLRLDRL